VSQPASITTRTEPGGTPVIVVTGDLDIMRAPALDLAIEACLRETPTRLVFDLKDVPFVDSAGLNGLIRAAAEGVAVELRDPSPAVRRLLELSGTAQILTVVATAAPPALPDPPVVVDEEPDEPDAADLSIEGQPNDPD
jgi:anti-anti-sigma factor